VEIWHPHPKKRLRLKILEARGGIEPPIMVLQTMSTIPIASVYASTSCSYTHSIPNLWYTWV
jgi:hypothetical protein